MKKLDIYIVKKFLSTFFFLFIILMSIAIIFDVSERIDDFIKTTPPLRAIIFEYYVNFVIFYGNLFSSLLIFIAVIFFTAKMASDTEIVAILSSGISFNRMLLPYFIANIILAGFSLYANHWLVPDANKKRLDFENTYIRNPYQNTSHDIHMQTDQGEIIYFESYNVKYNKGHRFSLEKWDGTELKMKINAASCQWDTLSKKWRLENYNIRNIDGMKESIIEGLKYDTVLNLSPKDFEKRLTNTEMMNYEELNSFIEDETRSGSEYIPYYEVEKNQRSSYPFATFVLTLIGVSVASRKVRGGIGLHIAYGLLICVTYILAMKVTTVYATNAGLNPLAAVWIPNVLFGLFSIYLYRKAPK